MARYFSAAFVLYVFWLVLSGYFEPFLLLMGVLSAAAAVLFAKRMDVVDREGHPIDIGLTALFSYWPWLIKEILKSAWDVTWRILHPKLPISPTLTRFRPSQHEEVGLVTHANSITLTPGTISIGVSREEFLVHALTREGAAGLAGSEMDRRVTKMMGE